MLSEEDRLLLLTVLSDDGIELEDKGYYYLGCCPFHDDSTPSFAVYKNTGKYTCFGCGEKGDVIDYVRKSKGVSFSQAVKYLDIKYDKRQYIKKRPSLVDVIAQEDKCGINVEEKYGKDFIDSLLARELVRRSNPDET